MKAIETEHGKTTESMQELTAKARASLGPPLRVGLLVMPGYLPMDINGVHAVFGAVGAELHLLWKNKDLLEGYPAWPTRPTTTFGECPRELDVLAVGMVPPELHADPEVIAFLAGAASAARYVIGICSGSLLLGAAGVLRGVRATSNANAFPMLSELGASPVASGGGVVVDGKFHTAGPGVGSFEAALLVLAALRGADVARLIELVLEYDPHPPFHTGTPAAAGPHLAAISREFTRDLNARYREAAGESYRRVTGGR